MDGTVRDYALATVLPVVAAIMLILFLSDNALDQTLMILALAICFPIIMMSLYMYLEGKGARLINGVDWTKYSEEERGNAASYLGFFMAVGCAILAVSLCVLISHMMFAIIIMVVSVLIMVVPAVRLVIGYKPSTRRIFSAKGKVSIYAIFLIITLASVFGLGLYGDESSGTVKIDLGDDSFSVKAPMFDETFTYSEIGELDYDPHFDKGDRIGGYGTPTISSGKFRNAQFGNYRLASYTQIDPCVWIKYHGGYYAFNLSTAEETHDLYEQLRVKTGL